MRLKTQRLAFGLLILGLLSLIVNGQKARYSNRESRNNAPRYAIVGNSLDDENKPKIASRHVEIYVETKTFSESNLRIIFSLVSKRFPSPQLLFVDVYTSLEQVLTPEEKDRGVTSEEPGGSQQFYWASYIRNGNDEFFRYSPVNDKSGNKLVQISGKVD